jgi:hypothetical protein
MGDVVRSIRGTLGYDDGWYGMVWHGMAGSGVESRGNVDLGLTFPYRRKIRRRLLVAHCTDAKRVYNLLLELE